MTSRVRGNSAITVQVKGASEIQKALSKWLDPELTKEIDTANKAAANTFAKALRPVVGAESKRMRRAVRVRRAKTGKPGWVVGSRRSVAFFWPFVIAGTKDHGPRKAKALVFESGGTLVVVKRVRGVKPTDAVEEVARRNEPRVARQIDQDMTRMTGT